jgi:F-type H+-transporting ATPase subunit b
MASPTSNQAGTAVPTQPQGGFPAFRTETFGGQILWLAITFGLLYYLMSKIALPRVQTVLDDRRHRIGADLEQAAASRSRAEEAGQAYELSLAEARAKAQAIAQETRTALTTESEVRRKGIESELAAKLAESEATIRARTESAMSNVREVATDAAGAIVERLTGRAPDRGAIETAYDRAARS